MPMKASSTAARCLASVTAWTAMAFPAVLTSTLAVTLLTRFKTGAAASLRR